MVEPSGTLLWGEGRTVTRLSLDGDRLSVVGEVAAEPGRSGILLDRIVAGSSSGEVTTLLDARGRILELRPGTDRSFQIPGIGAPAHITTGPDRVYLLLDEEIRGGGAVVAYGPDGELVGRWGTLPASAPINKALRGGGLTRCAGGDVFYSYIDSPRILRIRGEQVEEVGARRASFRRLSGREIRRARKASEGTHQVRPLAEAAFRSSRVLALHCDDDGRLYRHVAGPIGEGAEIEVWDSGTGTLVGTVLLSEGILLAVGGTGSETTLFVGSRTDDLGFVLDRLQIDRRATTAVEEGN